MSKTLAEEKEKFEKQLLDLKTKLEEKTQAEQNYQIKIRELEDNLANATKSLNEKVKENLSVEQLEKEVKSKEEDLKNIHQKLVDFQNQLKLADDKINQQDQKISQKNQQLTDLTNQLSEKDKLITNLQTEIANLKNPPTFRTNNKTDNWKGDESKINEENNKFGKETTNSYSQEDLEKLIKEHQQEVRKLKELITNSAKKTQEVEMVQELPQPKKLFNN